ncbi:MAG: hypothetical protein M3044_16375 [Thermoproteota archaeon]|nr:hypothetical protein [Thermoproteota archaeon]
MTTTTTTTPSDIRYVCKTSITNNLHNFFATIISFTNYSMLVIMPRALDALI